MLNQQYLESLALPLAGFSAHLLLLLQAASFFFLFCVLDLLLGVLQQYVYTKYQLPSISCELALQHRTLALLIWLNELLMAHRFPQVPACYVFIFSRRLIVDCISSSPQCSFALLFF